jgi:hypothetical protein
MTIFDHILWGISGWTLIEGSLIVCAPMKMLQWIGRLFPAALEAFGDLPPSQFRIYGAIEAGFGILLGAYMVWAT